MAWLQQLLTLIEYAVGGAILFLLGMWAGYSISRRPNPVAPEAGQFEGTIKNLEDETQKAKKAVEALYRSMKFRPQDDALKPSVTQTEGFNYVGADSFGARLLKFIKGMIGLTRNSNEQNARTDNQLTGQLEARLQNIKREVKDIKEKVEHADTFLPDVIEQAVSLKLAERKAPPVTGGDHGDRTDGEFAPGQGLNSSEAAEGKKRVIPNKTDERSDYEQRTANTSLATTATREVIELYNRAVTDNLVREEFREHYRPIRVGTVNAVERRQNPTIEAEFKETSDGDFFAFQSTRDGEYVVFPRLGLTIEAVSLNAGALGQVFGDPDYDAKLYYSHYQVQQPAIFKRDGERWTLERPGRLDLGRGE